MSPPLLPRALLERRAAAWCIDFLILAPPAWLLARWLWAGDLDAIGSALDAMRRTFHDTLFAAAENGDDPAALYAQLLGGGPLRTTANAVTARTTALLMHVALAYAALALPWHVGGELSAARGSLGKRLMHLRATADKGREPSIGQLLLRHVSGVLSWLTLNLGHLMVLRAPYRTLHDHIADTQVIAAAGTPPLPRWGRWLLRAVAVAAILLPLWFALKLALWLTLP